MVIEEEEEEENELVRHMREEQEEQEELFHLHRQAEDLNDWLLTLDLLGELDAMFPTE